MITLYSFPGRGPIPSASPFCVKLEAYMRMTKREFRTVVPKRPDKAPKGKLPYIEDNGRVIADSGFVIEYLKKTYGDPLDGDMSATDQAVAHAFRRLFEEDFYWVMVHARWFDESNWPEAKKQIFGEMPLLARLIAPGIVRKSLRKQITGHGMGRHSQEEIYKIGVEDLRAASAFLADKRYFMGDRMRTIDATVYPFVASVLWSTGSSSMKSEAAKLANLKPYCERLHQEVFGKALSAG